MVGGRPREGGQTTAWARDTGGGPLAPAQIDALPAGVRKAHRCGVRAARDVSPRAAASRVGRPAQSRFHGARAGRGGDTSASALRGTERARRCDTPAAVEDGASPIDCNRPSDRRSPGMDPGPQGAFEGSMINVSCNSHYFSQLAAFFIDARAE